ncbi:MAG: hypothetical protein LBS84_12965 [Clostridiales bacterium]|jgi:serine/threonine protein kinase|nr:hypothetical protein [Clostridiales bacterium]
MLLHGLNAQGYDLKDKPFNSGGEGVVYGVKSDPAMVVKIYNANTVSAELEEKLKIMVRRPPSSGVETQVAWPRDVLYDAGGKFVGFAMPRLNIDEELTELYKYPPRQYNATTSEKIIIAQNICAVISEVHRAGYVFGDFNPGNIGVDIKTGRVAFLDTDSYHIYDRESGKTYRCKVCLQGYAAPEVLKACADQDFADAPLPTFTKESDNFALAIHIFKLLMNGFNPYNGINDNEKVSQASPARGNDAIKRDAYCFKIGKKHISPAVPPLRAMPDEIGELFKQAFIDGRSDPMKRPNAMKWHRALENYKKGLKTCGRDNRHQYANHLSSCPWCEADERYASATMPQLKQQVLQAPLSASTPQTAPGAFMPPVAAQSQAQGSAKTPKAAPKRLPSRQQMIFITDIANVIVTNLIYGCFVGAAFMALLSSVYGIWLRGVHFKELPEFLQRVYDWYVAFPPKITEGTFHTLLVLSAVVPILLSTIPPVVRKLRANSGQNRTSFVSHGVGKGFAFFAMIFNSLLPGVVAGTICLYIAGIIWELAWGIRILVWPLPKQAMLSAGIPFVFFVWRAINKQLRMPACDAVSSLLDSLCAILCAIMGFSAGFVAIYAELGNLDAYNRSGYTTVWSVINALLIALISNKNSLHCKTKISIAIALSFVSVFILNRLSAMMY